MSNIQEPVINKSKSNINSILIRYYPDFNKFDMD